MGDFDMARKILIALAMAAVVGATSPALAGACKDCDKVAKGSDGFCCGKGKAFGVQLTSPKLYTALEGREVSAEDAKKCPCPDCKKALETKGSCDRCKFTAGKMYKSPVAYALAKGMPMPAELVAACPQRCGQCKIAHKENGRCEKCGVGFVANRMFEGDAVYEEERDTKAAVRLGIDEGFLLRSLIVAVKK